MKEDSSLQVDYNQEGKTSQHVVSIPAAHPDWVASVEKRIMEMPKLLNKSAGRRDCSIFRVPQSLFNADELSYKPHVVSIGPYHHGKPDLQMVQEHKWRFLGNVLARTKQDGVGLNELFEAIAVMEEKVRDCYSEHIGFRSHELIEIMIVDGCFIIELFCMVGQVIPVHEDDPLLTMARMFWFLMQDLLRLENQIPFFVLQSLFEISVSSPIRENAPSLPKLALGFFNLAAQRPDEHLEWCKNLEGRHLLDLFRLSFIPSSLQESRGMRGPSYRLIHSAKKLHLVGIQFSSWQKAESFLEVKFSEGVLEIPTLTVDGFTCSFLLNCVAFEDCYQHCSKHITAYLVFMGCLIQTPTDAGLLCDHAIIENFLGTEAEVASFFDKATKDATFDIDRSYLSWLFRDVDQYYTTSWRIQFKAMKNAVTETPWPLLSIIAAITLLLLTVIQSFFAVYAYYRPPN